MKYHCTKRPLQDLTIDDNFFKVIKVINLGKYKLKCDKHSFILTSYVTVITVFV